MHDKTIAKRAFELAADGTCRSVDDIRRKLVAEHYDAVQVHIGGPTITRQLRAAIKAGRTGTGGRSGD